MCKATLKLCQKCAIFRSERILGMKREIESAFSSWKKRNDRKPLVLMGARQVGKSWLMENFGRANFRDIHIFDFVAMPDIASIFSRTKDPNEILPKLEIISGRKSTGMRMLSYLTKYRIAGMHLIRSNISTRTVRH